MSRRSLAALVAFAALSIPSLVTAMEFHDAETNFRLTVDFPDARVCVLKPAEMTEASACGGVDLEQARKGTRDPRSRLVALVIRPTGMWFLGVLLVDRPPGPFSARTAIDAASGVHEGFKRRFADVDLLKPADFVVHGAHAFRFENTWAAGKFPYDAAWTGVVVGERHLVQVQLMGTSAELPAMEKAGDTILQTAQEPNPGKAAREPISFRRLVRSAPLLLSLAALLLFGGIFVVRARRRKRR